MKLWIAVLVSVLVAAATALSSPSIVARLSIGSVSFLDIADPKRVGAAFIAVVMGSVVYGVVVTVLLAFAIILDMLGACDVLRFAPSSGHYLFRRDWEAAFSSETLKPARHRIVTQLARTDDEHLFLAVPFSPTRARMELRAIYFRQLAVAQVWTVVGALLLSAIIAALFSTEETTLAMIRPIFLGLAMVIASIGITWLAVSIVVDTLTSALADALFSTKPSLAVRNDSQAEKAADDEHLANAIAANLRSGIETIAFQRDDLYFTTLEQSLAARLPEIIADAISTALMQCFGDARPTIERMAEATTTLRLELPARIVEASEVAMQRISTDHVEAIRLASGMLVVEQKAIAEKIDELRRVVTDGHDLELEALRQLATELCDVGPGLHAVLREVSAEAAKERAVDAHKTTELVRSMEAYAASLLPAIKRLESYDERVLRAMNHESETLSQLTVSLSDLSGTLEVLRIQLGHGPVRFTPEHAHSVPHAPQPSRDITESGRDDMTGLAGELRSLLDDLDEERQSI